MAVMAHFLQPPVTLLNHEEHLKELYAKDIGYVPKPMFNIFTPFRMDLEAEKVALEMVKDDVTKESTLHRQCKRRKKRKVQLPHMSQQVYEDMKATSSLLTKSLSYLKLATPELFSNIPSVDFVRENNRPVRCLVQSIQSNISDLECPIDGKSCDQKKSNIITLKGMFYIKGTSGGTIAHEGISGGDLSFYILKREMLPT